MPETETLGEARAACRACTRCDLWRNATQAVFGEGAGDAGLMIVGEQPGDQEDLQGRPFVGPAGQVLDRALAEARIERGGTWLTNAVKHFKFVVRGKRRLHQAPNAGEVRACRWWLDLERDLVKPRVTVGLGGTAALALTGRKDGITRRRGTVEETKAGPVLLSWHPSYILRIPDAEGRERARAELARDLARAGELAG